MPMLALAIRTMLAVRVCFHTALLANTALQHSCSSFASSLGLDQQNVRPGRAAEGHNGSLFFLFVSLFLSLFFL